MPLVIPLVAAGVGAAATVGGAAIGANAQSNIAKSQQAQAAADRAQAMQYAMPTAQEIQSIGDRLQQQQRYQAVQEAGLERDQKILGSLDPALVTAGQQANELMQGKSAAIIAPMQQQQAFERNKLKQQLAAQLGPGFETSSVGQNALQQFDMNANMQTQQAQMSAFNQVSQFLGFNLGQRTALVGEERRGFETGSEMSGRTLSAMGDIQHREVGASLGTSGALQATAGAEHVGAAAGASAISSFGAGAMTLGGTLMGKVLGSPEQGETSKAGTMTGSTDYGMGEEPAIQNYG